MKTSASLFLTDIMPEKRSWFNKIVKNDVFGNNSPHHVFNRLKQSGVEGIELLLPSYAKITLEDIQKLKEILAENTMPVFSVHQTIRLLSMTKIDEIKTLFEIAKMLSAKVIVLHMSSAGKQIFDKEYIQTIHELEKQYGIKAGFENREKFIGSLTKPYGWDEKEFGLLMKDKNFSITLDTQHLAQAGGDIIEFFKKNKDRIVNIHISDYKHHILNSSLRPLRFRHMPLGKGQLPIDEFLKTLKKENYKGLVTMEIHTDLEGLCESARMITGSKK